MQKTILTAIFAVLFSFVQSQEKPFKVGVKAGLSNLVYYNDDYNQTGLPGIVAGLQTEYRFADKQYLGTELLYDRNTTEIGILGHKLKSTVNGINLPIFYKYATASEVRILAGLQPSYIFASGTDDFRCAALTGVGYVTTYGFTFDIRYTVDFTKAWKDSYEIFSAFNFTIGWLF